MTALTGMDCKEITPAVLYLLTVKRELCAADVNSYKEFLTIMLDFKNQRIDNHEATVRLRELFKDHDHLFLGFENLQKGEKPFGKESQEIENALDLVYKIKEHFRDDKFSYNSFLKILVMYGLQKKTVDDVHLEVDFLLRDQPDLLKEFRQFLPADLAKTPLPHPSSGITSKSHDERMAMVNHAQGDKVAARTCSLDSDYRFRTGYLHSEHVRNEKSAFQNSEQDWDGRENGCNRLTIEHGKMDTDNGRDDNFMGEHMQKGDPTNFSALYGEHMAGSTKLEDKDDRVTLERDKIDKKKSHQRNSSIEKNSIDETSTFVSKDTDFQEQTSFADDELASGPDFSACQLWTPSYHILPENYPKPLARSRTEADASVLNDDLITVVSGREEYSGVMAINKYEEILHQCDDDRYESDMLLELLAATADRVEKLSSEVTHIPTKEGILIQIEKRLTSLHMRCIEGIYDEYGLEIVDILCNNVTTALPVILARLKQKKSELIKYRSAMNKIWKNKFAQIYDRSLDYRSFCFKQQDVKMLNPKALLAEAKEFSEKKREEDDVLLQAFANNRRPKSPDMEFLYIDLAIHEDLYDIIKYSCADFTSDKQLDDEVMRIWTTIEPILGIFRHPRKVESKAQNINKRVSDGSSKSVHEDGREKFAAPDAVDPGMNGGDNILRQPKRLCQTRVGLECEVSESSREVALLNHGCTTERNNKIYRYHGGSSVHDTFNIEREEGEILPSREEDNLLVIGDVLDRVPEITDYASKHYHVGAEKLFCHGEPTGEVDVSAGDIDDGSPGSSAGNSEDLSCEDLYEEEENASPDGNTECEIEAEKMACMQHAEGERMPSVSKDCCFDALRPLREHKSKLLHDNEGHCCRIFYGSSSFYVLFRLHQILYKRLLFAKKSTSNSHIKQRILKETCSPDLYAKFKLSLHNLLNGSANNLKFEDDCRSLIGNRSYELFTLDKLIHKIVKQLQEIASSDKDKNLLQLHAYENSRGPGVFGDNLYYENARTIVHGESMFRFQYSLNPTRLSIELMEYGNEECEEAPVSLHPEFSAYLHHDFLSSCSEKERHNIFLGRNKRRFERVYGVSSTFSSMEGVQIFNDLRYKMDSSSKVSFVQGTEDFFIRMRKKRRRARIICSAQPTPESEELQNIN